MLAARPFGPSRGVVLRVALNLAIILVHYWLVPASYTSKPLLALVLFAILTIVASRSREISTLPGLSAGALLLFLFLHALLLAAALQLEPLMTRAALTPGLPSSLLAISKLLIVAPSVALFPECREFLRDTAPELAAALIALFTFSPDRFIVLIWPAYSRVVGGIIAAASQALLPGTQLSKASEGVVVIGPNADMLLGPSCSGIKSIILFQIVFCLVLMVEWNHLQKPRALVFYVSVCAALLVANIVRLTIVFIVLNLTSLVLDLSWPLFLFTFLGLATLTRNWMELHGAPGSQVHNPAVS